MSMKNVWVKIINNRENVAFFFCFWSIVAFNILCFVSFCFHLFNYDGGINNPKSYGEIGTFEVAHNVFVGDMVKTSLYGLLFAFPIIWNYFFISRINLNAICLQLIPYLISLGIALFS